MRPPPEPGLAGRVREAVEGVLQRPLDPAEARHLERGPWLARDARRRRDELLRDLGATFTGTVNARAGMLQAEIRHYDTVCWRHDRRHGGPVPRTERREILHALFSLGGEVPQSLRRLGTILGNR